MGVSEIRGTLFGVLTIRILLFKVLYWGPPIFGNSHQIMSDYQCCFGFFDDSYVSYTPPPNLVLFIKAPRLDFQGFLSGLALKRFTRWLHGVPGLLQFTDEGSLSRV